MMRVTAGRLAQVPYSTLFSYNLILHNVFAASPERTAIICEASTTDKAAVGHSSVHTYGELQEDVLSCAAEYLAVRALHHRHDSGSPLELVSKSKKEEPRNSRWPSEAAVWMQQPRPSNVQSIFAASSSPTASASPRFSCDVLPDDGRYNAALLCSPSYEFVVGLLALWAINMMAVPVCHSHHYETEMSYTIQHSRSRLLVAEERLMKAKLPMQDGGYEKLLVNMDEIERESTTTGLHSTSKIVSQGAASTSSSSPKHNTFEIESVFNLSQRVQRYREQRDAAARKQAESVALVVEEILDVEEPNQKIETSDDVLARLELEKVRAAQREEERNVDDAIRQFREQNSKVLPPVEKAPRSDVSAASAAWSVSSQGLTFDDTKLETLHPFFRTRFLQLQQQQQQRQQACSSSGAGEEIKGTFLPCVHDDALMIYTSGTTARPKGVVHTHQSVSQQVAVLLDAWRWTQEDRILNVLPLHHVHGLVNILLCALAANACCVFTPFDDATRIVKRLAAGDLTLFMGVPTIYSKLIDAVETKLTPIEKTGWRNSVSTCVRLMVCGSAALPIPTLQRFYAISGHTLLERYGMTEVGMALSQRYLPLSMRQPGTVGEPLAGVETLLVPVPVEEETEGGEKGEQEKNKGNEREEEEAVYHLGLRGPALFDRYWANPQATKDAVLTLPHSPSSSTTAQLKQQQQQTTASSEGERFFDTGDTVGVSMRRIARPGNSDDDRKPQQQALPFYRILGRTSVDILKCRGYKLSALEIEAALLLDASLVHEVAVLGSEHPTLGEQIVAVVKPAEQWNDTRDEEGLRKKLKAAALKVLTPYKCPTKYVFVWDGIPRNAMGKVNKKQLKKTLQL
jgi:acyl-CoA synthetase (AMP-forming)/AMP-acid ligase II